MGAHHLGLCLQQQNIMGQPREWCVVKQKHTKHKSQQNVIHLLVEIFKNDNKKVHGRVRTLVICTAEVQAAACNKDLAQLGEQQHQAVI